MSNFTQTIGYFEKLITSSSFHLPQVFQRHQKGWTLFLVIRYFHEILDKNVLEEWISPFSTLCRVEKSSKTRSSITTVFTVYSSNQRFHKIVDFTEIFERDRCFRVFFHTAWLFRIKSIYKHISNLNSRIFFSISAKRKDR